MSGGQRVAAAGEDSVWPGESRHQETLYIFTKKLVLSHLMSEGLR